MGTHMTKNKPPAPKVLSMRYNGFWLITIAAVSALLNPDRGPFITVVTWIVIISGTTLCIYAQREELEDRARRDHED